MPDVLGYIFGVRLTEMPAGVRIRLILSVTAHAGVAQTLFRAVAFRPAASAFAQTTVTYVATLQPMNTNVTGSQASGNAQFTITGDTLAIDINVKEVPPDTIHWQHFHGFKDNRDATCPTAAAETNHDGIIDLIETEPSSGVTMVPFDDDPAAMDVAHGTYPKASADSTYHYQKAVSVTALQAAFSKAFTGQQLDLERRVVFIHGVPTDTKLPASVASLGPIPAHVALPIACGKIERVAR